MILKQTILRRHKIHTRIVHGRLEALDIGQGWIDVTNWTEYKLLTWLGY